MRRYPCGLQNGPLYHYPGITNNVSVKNRLCDYLEEIVKCMACRHKSPNMCLLPCRHLALCRECFVRPPRPQNCPDCGKQIENQVEVYLPWNRYVDMDLNELWFDNLSFPIKRIYYYYHYYYYSAVTAFPYNDTLLWPFFCQSDYVLRDVCKICKLTNDSPSDDSHWWYSISNLLSGLPLGKPWQRFELVRLSFTLSVQPVVTTCFQLNEFLRQPHSLDLSMIHTVLRVITGKRPMQSKGRKYM